MARKLSSLAVKSSVSQSMASPYLYYLALTLSLRAVAPSSSCPCRELIEQVVRINPFIPYSVEDEEKLKLEYLQKSRWIAMDKPQIIERLANTDGFRMVSAILEQKSLDSLICVSGFYMKRNGTSKMFIPDCGGISMYIRELENEKEMLEKDPGIMEDLRSGRRYVHTLENSFCRFYGGGNVSISRPFVYSDDEGGVVVHGTDGFGSLEFPQGAVGKVKIEMAVVANIVPIQKNYDWDHDSLQWIVGSQMFGSDKLERMIRSWKEEQLPYGITMLYSLHF